jgi:lipoate-protein ligase A
MLIVQSKSTDVYRNLAMEEWLLDHTPALPVLFLCVNDPCVVIGKNQNPWRECRLSLMEKEGVPLARRISGGGAVYHDAGNLNVGVIVSRTSYDEQKQYELIFRALERFGIHGERVGKNSLAASGLKFSGQAFCYRKNRVLHHGTLLVNADLKRLGRYLGPELEGVETRAVTSVPAKVMNLADAGKELTVEKLSAALIEIFQGMYGRSGAAECRGDGTVPEEEVLPVIEKRASTEWKLCHTPCFRVTLGGQTICVEKGRVQGVENHPLLEEWRKNYAADV